MNYIAFYSVVQNLHIDAADLLTAEAKAKIHIAEFGSRAKMLCIRQMDALPEPYDIPHPDRKPKKPTPEIDFDKFPG